MIDFFACLMILIHCCECDNASFVLEVKVDEYLSRCSPFSSISGIARFDK